MMRERKEKKRGKKIIIKVFRRFLLKTRCFVATFVRSTVSKRCMHAKNTFCYWVPEIHPFDLLSTSNEKSTSVAYNHHSVTCSTAFTRTCTTPSMEIWNRILISSSFNRPFRVENPRLSLRSDRVGSLAIVAPNSRNSFAIKFTRYTNFTREHVPRSIRCFTTVTKLQRNYRREMVIADWSGYGQKSIEAHVSRRSERPAELSARIYGNGRSLFFVHLFQLLFHPASRARSFQSC